MQNEARKVITTDWNQIVELTAFYEHELVNHQYSYTTSGAPADRS
jgi:hypothetical protein